MDLESWVFVVTSSPQDDKKLLGSGFLIFPFLDFFGSLFSPEWVFFRKFLISGNSRNEILPILQFSCSFETICDDFRSFLVLSGIFVSFQTHVCISEPPSIFFCTPWPFSLIEIENGKCIMVWSSEKEGFRAWLPLTYTLSDFDRIQLGVTIRIMVWLSSPLTILVPS